MTEQILLVAGILMTVFGLGVLANTTLFRKTMANFVENPGMIFLVGIVNIILGLFLILNHNDWSQFPNYIVTFLGWAAFFRGIMMILSPKLFLSIFKAVWFNHHLKGESIFVIAIGLVFIYLAIL